MDAMCLSEDDIKHDATPGYCDTYTTWTGVCCIANINTVPAPTDPTAIGGPRSSPRYLM
jgi:hypothetical protein